MELLHAVMTSDLSVVDRDQLCSRSIAAAKQEHCSAEDIVDSTSICVPLPQLFISSMKDCCQTFHHFPRGAPFVSDGLVCGKTVATVL